MLQTKHSFMQSIHFQTNGNTTALVVVVCMIMVQFEDSLRQRLEVQIFIRSSYSKKIFYETKKFDELCAHYNHGPKKKKQMKKIESWS
jgi:hypothetical protein